MNKPKEMIANHEEDGQGCGCVGYEEETPCEIRAEAFNDACELYEKREQKLLENITKHYYIYGYEKQHYLKEILEEYLKVKIRLANE